MRVKRSNFLVIFTSGAATSGNKKKFNMFISTIINTGNQIRFALYLFNARTFFSFAKFLILAVCESHMNLVYIGYFDKFAEAWENFSNVKIRIFKEIQETALN